jgi:hypothetical protein
MRTPATIHHFSFCDKRENRIIDQKFIKMENFFGEGKIFVQIVCHQKSQWGGISSSSFHPLHFILFMGGLAVVMLSSRM